MTMVDTSAWVDFLAGRDAPHVQLLKQHVVTQRIAVGDLIMCEVLQGLRSEREFQRVRWWLATLEVVPMCDAAMAVQAARNYRLLRNQGITIRRTLDCLIATCCLTRGYVLLHNDRDFDPFEEHLGLRVIHPLASSTLPLD